jgi:hypothetical protein
VILIVAVIRLQLEMGRECVDHYSEQHRYCVFSHDELVCKMAAQVSTLSIPMAAAVCKDMNNMVRVEVSLRKEITSYVSIRKCFHTDVKIVQLWCTILAKMFRAAQNIQACFTLYS